jgi:hypothetical protein
VATERREQDGSEEVKGGAQISSRNGIIQGNKEFYNFVVNVYRELTNEEIDVNHRSKCI